MKYAKKKKKSPLVAALWILTVLLALLVGLVILLETGNMPGQDIPGTTAGQPQPSPTEETAAASEQQTTQATDAHGEPEPAQTQAPTVPTETTPAPAGTTEAADNPELIELETPYCPLYFPGMWEDLLHINPVEAEDYRVEFGCRFEGEAVCPLFDISFGTVSGTPLGWVSGPGGGQVQISVKIHEPEEYLEGDLLETFLAMQDDVNRLIALLPLEEQQQTQQIQQSQTGADVVIETPFCTLTYPGRWEDYLQVEHTGGEHYCVEFFAVFGEDKIPLFSLRFRAGAEDAMLVLEDAEGKTVGVNIEMPDADRDDLTPEQQDVVHAMRDALNDMLDALMAQ